MLFRPIFQSALRWGKTKFVVFFKGASATKRLTRSRIFRYGCLKIILSKRQKTSEGGAYTSLWTKWLNDSFCPRMHANYRKKSDLKQSQSCPVYKKIPRLSLYLLNYINIQYSYKYFRFKHFPECSSFSLKGPPSKFQILTYKAPEKPGEIVDEKSFYRISHSTLMCLNFDWFIHKKQFLKTFRLIFSEIDLQNKFSSTIIPICS